MFGLRFFFFFQAEDGIRDAQESRGLGDVYKRQARQVVQWFSACGMCNAEIERRTGLSHNFVWTWAQRSASDNAGPSGPAPMISRALAKRLKKAIVKVRFGAAHMLRGKTPVNPSTGKRVSARTIQRALNAAGAISVRVRKAQALTQIHKDRRLAWCQLHESAGTDFADWTFSDEKWWMVGGVKGNERIWVSHDDPDPEERYVGFEAHPVKVMIWGAVSYHGRSSIHIFDGGVDSETYQDCLEQAYLPACFEGEYLALSRTHKYVFQQDGARCHTSKSTQAWLLRELPKNIALLEKNDWPAKSPDLSPIERLWAIIQDKVIEEQALDLQSLIKCVEKWWWAIPQTTIQKLYDSMPSRLARCIGANGAHFRV
eukprot:TRINITY_DN60393_c0_g1_i1.p1 TRINITY_DN60393_c0_g1~~TRINITY_DN60393_c0_g1_i1.p1  ORF type:complete len:371 (-),score=36.65 TRINITY_DN60393_c0_g1_i1:26-1138(-)